MRKARVARLTNFSPFTLHLFNFGHSSAGCLAQPRGLAQPPQSGPMTPLPVYVYPFGHPLGTLSSCRQDPNGEGRGPPQCDALPRAGPDQGRMARD
jgi:hypothetical protein